MSDDSIVTTIQEVLADALYLGMEIADNNYQGLIVDDANQPLRSRIGKLHSSTEQFLQEASLADVPISRIWPLMQELQERAEAN